MRLTAFLILILSLIAVTGCERVGRMTGAPSKTSLPDYYPAGTDKGEKVAVCYGGATTSMEALAAAAAELCKEPGSTVDVRDRGPASERMSAAEEAARRFHLPRATLDQAVRRAEAASALCAQRQSHFVSIGCRSAGAARSAGRTSSTRSTIWNSGVSFGRM